MILIIYIAYKELGKAYANMEDYKNANIVFLKYDRLKRQCILLLRLTNAQTTSNRIEVTQKEVTIKNTVAVLIVKKCYSDGN